MIIQRLIVGMMVLGIVVGITRCNRVNTPSSIDPVTVLCTTGMIADVATAIGGSAVTVEGLMGPGVDPHMYRASEGDIRRLKKADIVFYNGLDLEAKMVEFLVELGRKKTVVAVTQAIPTASLMAVDEAGVLYDPHVWFDMVLFGYVVQEIGQQLGKILPEKKAYFDKNTADYQEKLRALEQYTIARLARVPTASRVLVTAHDAFGYFGKAYGFNVVALQGVSTQSKAGLGDVQALAKRIVVEKIPALFIESSVAPRAIQALQDAVVAQGWQVKMGGELYSDALGEAGTAAGTYLGMVRHNIDTIANALSPQD